MLGLTLGFCQVMDPGNSCFGPPLRLKAQGMDPVLQVMGPVEALNSGYGPRLGLGLGLGPLRGLTLTLTLTLGLGLGPGLGPGLGAGLEGLGAGL